MKYFLIAIVILSIFVLSGCVSQSTYETLQKENESLKIEVNQLTEDFNLEQESNLSLDAYNIRLQKELELYKNTFGTVQENVEIPYGRLEYTATSFIYSSGVYADMPVYTDVSMKINNNLNAVNPTWERLVNFLEKDKTENIRYWDDPLIHLDPLTECDCEANCECNVFVCSDFAMRLHDNAEAEKIRAAVVIVYVEGKEQPHALNAFVTTDKGLVYIDCTGEKDCKGWDAVFYIKKGKEIGAAKLNNDIPLDYEWFAHQVVLLKEYNQEVENFNTEIKDKVYTFGTVEERRIKLWEERLIGLEKQLSIFIYGGGGIVTNVEIYW